MNRTQSHSAGPRTASSEIESGPSTRSLVTPRIPGCEFRLLLSSRRRQLLEDSQGTLLQAGGDAASGGELSTAQRNLRNLLAIESALARFGEGVFGVCVACGSEIDRGRLNSDPTSVRCLPCDVRAADGQNWLRAQTFRTRPRLVQETGPDLRRMIAGAKRRNVRAAA